jgi:DNA-binding NarL/FixJ family response regulator
MRRAAANAAEHHDSHASLMLLDQFDDVRSQTITVDTRPIKVLVVDGHPVVRAGLRALLESEQDIAVAGEAADGFEAVAVAGELRPAVVLVDAGVPGLDVMQVTERIVDSSDHAGTSVLVLAARETDECLFEALRAGASGFLVKTTEPVDLVDAVRVAAAGEALLSPGATRRLIAEFASQPKPQIPSDEQLDELTAREREVMTLVAAGLSNDEIAERLVISPATAKTHVSRVLGKLDVRDRAQLVAVAYQVGLVRPGLGRRVLRSLPTAPPALAAA